MPKATHTDTTSAAAADVAYISHDHARPTRRSTLSAAVAMIAGAVVGTGSPSVTSSAPRLSHGVAGASAGHPDAALIMLCNEFSDCHHALWVIHDGPNAEPDEDVATAASMPLWDRQRSIAAAIFRGHARTADGIVALAHTLAVHASDGGFTIDPNPETVGGQLSMTLMREVIQFHGEPIPNALQREPAAITPAVPAACDPSPDAFLLASCDAFHAAHRDLKANPGGTAALEALSGFQLNCWYKALEAAVAHSAETPAGRRAMARVAYVALNDVMSEEERDDHREEFAALVVLAELAGKAVA